MLCYLPSEYSKWGHDATGFYNHLLMQMYDTSDSDMLIIVGDLNSRIGNSKDFGG